MFTGGLNEWNLNQLLLVNWLRFYYNRVYSLSDDEAVPEDLIQYDLLLDDWLENKDAQEKSKRRKDSQKFGMR